MNEYEHTFHSPKIFSRFQFRKQGEKVTAITFFWSSSSLLLLLDAILLLSFQNLNDNKFIEKKNAQCGERVYVLLFCDFWLRFGKWLNNNSQNERTKERKKKVLKIYRYYTLISSEPIFYDQDETHQNICIRLSFLLYCHCNKKHFAIHKYKKSDGKNRDRTNS